LKEYLEILSVILLSSVKMGIGGIPLSFVYKFSLLKSITTTSLGGCLGAFVFVNLSDGILKLLDRWGIFRPKKKIKKKFTYSNRLVVNIKRRFGLLGISAVTPLFLSFPFGCFLAVRYFKDKKKITAYMFGSTIFWSVTISLIKTFL
jgi:hypothetical protein